MSASVFAGPGTWPAGPECSGVQVASPGPASPIGPCAVCEHNRPCVGARSKISVSMTLELVVLPQSGCCRGTTQPAFRRTSLPPHHTHPLIWRIKARSRLTTRRRAPCSKACHRLLRPIGWVNGCGKVRDACCEQASHFFELAGAILEQARRAFAVLP